MWSKKNHECSKKSSNIVLKNWKTINYYVNRRIGISKWKLIIIIIFQEQNYLTT